jgi:hypothetical protein
MSYTSNHPGGFTSCDPLPWGLPSDEEQSNHAYALSHDGGEVQPFSPSLVASRSPSSLPSAIPIPNHHEQANLDISPLDMNSFTFGGSMPHLGHDVLAGLAFSRSENLHLMTSPSFPPLHDAYAMSFHSSYGSRIGSGHNSGGTFGSFDTGNSNAINQTLGSSLLTPFAMRREDSNSSQDFLFNPLGDNTYDLVNFTALGDPEFMDPAIIEDMYSLPEEAFAVNGEPLVEADNQEEEEAEEEQMEEEYDNTPSRRVRRQKCKTDDGSEKPKGSGGRKNPLTPEKKKNAALMRKIKACASCKERKVSCSPHIPCRSCVTHYKEDLLNHPCRGDQVEGITNCMILENAFPRGLPDRFMKPGYIVEDRIILLKFDLAFGSRTMEFNCQPIITKEGYGPVTPCLHTHMDYPWPPPQDASNRSSRIDLVFPARLAPGQNLHGIVERYLEDCLLDLDTFREFPFYVSPLKVLKGIYLLYRQLPDAQAEPLKAALKLLILVHMGGDLKVCRDDKSHSILSRYYTIPNSGFEEFKVTPCFVRSELGPVFSQVAHRLMTDVLKRLEVVSQSTDRAKFPVIIATFATLAMSLESLQYHVSKLAYHSHDDDYQSVFAALQGGNEPQTRDLVDDGQEILLRVYQGTQCHALIEPLGTGAKTNLSFSNCSMMTPLGPDSIMAAHERNRRNSNTSISAGARRNSVGSQLSSRSARSAGGSAFLDGLHNAIRDSLDHLNKKANLDVASYHDLSAPFDRVMAKLFLQDKRHRFRGE